LLLFSSILLTEKYLFFDIKVFLSQFKFEVGQIEDRLLGEEETSVSDQTVIFINESTLIEANYVVNTIFLNKKRAAIVGLLYLQSR